MALLGISPLTVLVCIGLGVAMMVAASYGPIRRINRMGIIEALGKYSVGYETEEYRKRTDLFLVLLPLAIYGAILALSGEYGRGPSLLLFLLYIFLAVGVLSLPFTPFMLILGATRLLTRATNKTYQLVSGTFKPLVRPVYPLVARNLSRNPRRTSRVAVLIALSLSFGTFIMVFSSTEQRLQESLVLFEAGSDIKITNSWSVNHEELRKIEGVAASCLIVRCSAESRFGELAIYALEPVQYRSCVGANRHFTKKLSRLLDELSTEKRGVLVARTPQETGWKQGQLVSLPVADDGKKLLDFQILGFFDYAPGLEETLRRGRWDPPTLLARADYLLEEILDLPIRGQRTVLLKAAGGIELLGDRGQGPEVKPGPIELGREKRRANACRARPTAHGQCLVLFHEA